MYSFIVSNSFKSSGTDGLFLASHIAGRELNNWPLVLDTHPDFVLHSLKDATTSSDFPCALETAVRICFIRKGGHAVGVAFLFLMVSGDGSIVHVIRLTTSAVHGVDLTPEGLEPYQES